eukprot:Hpha_TRINITY_DN19156_c0_g1::TRINITY_DN19156_c0_g1_i1::g.94779::m.94779
MASDLGFRKAAVRLRDLQSKPSEEQARLQHVKASLARASSAAEPGDIQAIAELILLGGGDDWTEVRSAVARGVSGVPKAALHSALSGVLYHYGKGWRAEEGACRLVGALVPALELCLPLPSAMRVAADSACNVTMPASPPDSSPTPPARPLYRDPFAEVTAADVEELEAAVRESGSMLHALSESLRSSPVSAPLLRCILECLQHSVRPVCVAAISALCALSARSDSRSVSVLVDWGLVAASHAQKTDLAESGLCLAAELLEAVPRAASVGASARARAAALGCFPRDACSVRQAAVRLHGVCGPNPGDAEEVSEVLGALVGMISNPTPDWRAVDAALMCVEDLLMFLCSKHRSGVGVLKQCAAPLAALLTCLGAKFRQLPPSGGAVTSFDILRGASQVLPPLAEAAVRADVDIGGAKTPQARYWVTWKAAAVWMESEEDGHPPNLLGLSSQWAAGEEQLGEDDELFAVRTRLVAAAYGRAPGKDLAEVLTRAGGIKGVAAPGAL